MSCFLTQIIALDINLPVKQAFHILHERGLSVAPLWDFCKSQFVGVLSASDFILILKELGNHGSHLTEEQLETHTIAAWKEGKLHLTRTMDGNGGSFPRRQLIHVSASFDFVPKDLVCRGLVHLCTFSITFLYQTIWLGWYLPHSHFILFCQMSILQMLLR
ncbi:hypothetical protein F2P56_019325 [Juglans regia]|uniref:CBS domain-containing protein n=1 Tax=Juglans regia TaxID=51240 RepID=A0A833XBI3_JUGRE|nr:hypothetical protein F2P56_019325 [Juglans regia]